MDKLNIYGNSSLKGSIIIPGSKNATLPLMACSLLSNNNLELINSPNLDDIATMRKLLKSFGIKFKDQNNSMTLITKNVSNAIADYNLVRKMRASILVLGPLLSRFKTVKISLPGGCSIGTRPIDLHLYGLKKLGASFFIEDGYVRGTVKKKLIGN